MGVLEDWYLKAREGVYSFGKKAGKYLDISKMKIKVAECENAIDMKMRKIGEIVYDKVQNDQHFDKSDILDIVADIHSLERDKKKYVDKMNSLKGKCACKSCNSLNNYDAQFCSSCGNSLVRDDDSCADRKSDRCTVEEDSNLEDITDDCDLPSDSDDKN